MASSLVVTYNLHDIFHFSEWLYMHLHLHVIQHVLRAELFIMSTGHSATRHPPWTWASYRLHVKPLPKVYKLWNVSQCCFIIRKQIICVTQEAEVNFSFIIRGLRFSVTVIMTLTAVLLDRFLGAALCHKRLLAANWNRQIFLVPLEFRNVQNPNTRFCKHDTAIPCPNINAILNY